MRERQNKRPEERKSEKEEKIAIGKVRVCRRETTRSDRRRREDEGKAKRAHESRSKRVRV